MIYAPRVTVQSGTLKYHITRLDNMSPETIDHEVLDRSKFDINYGFQVQEQIRYGMM